MKDVGIVKFPGSLDIEVLTKILTSLSIKYRIIDSSIYSLSNLKAVIIPGGFSYGDYIRTGAIAATSNIMKDIKREILYGLPVLAICNGFQICCESGIIDGALTYRNDTKFKCELIELKIKRLDNVWLQEYKGFTIKLPIKNSIGRFINNDKANIEAISYIDDVNDSTAAIMNEQGNLLAIMPHPEYATSNLSDSTDGLPLFLSLQSIL